MTLVVCPSWSDPAPGSRSGAQDAGEQRPRQATSAPRRRRRHVGLSAVGRVEREGGIVSRGSPLGGPGCTQFLKMTVRITTKLIDVATAWATNQAMNPGIGGVPTLGACSSHSTSVATATFAAKVDP
jgi:hypothetical protein